MIKRLGTGAILSVALVLGLSGCAASSEYTETPVDQPETSVEEESGESADNDGFDVAEVTLPSGRTVICVVHANGIACDFDRPQ